MFDTGILEHVEHPPMHPLLLTRPLTLGEVVGEHPVSGLMPNERLAEALEFTGVVSDAFHTEQVKLAADAEFVIFTAVVGAETPTGSRQVLGEPEQLPLVRAMFEEDSQDAVAAFWTGGPPGDADRSAENGRNIKWGGDRSALRLPHGFAHLPFRLTDNQLLSCQTIARTILCAASVSRHSFSR